MAGLGGAGGAGTTAASWGSLSDESGMVIGQLSVAGGRVERGDTAAGTVGMVVGRVGSCGALTDASGTGDWGAGGAGCSSLWLRWGARAHAR